jgi:hypothetical protein
MQRLCWVLSFGLALALLSLAGCRRESSPASGASRPDTAGPGLAPSDGTKPDQSVWTPDPNLVSQLKQTGDVGDYRLSLPPEFTAVAAPGVPGNIKSATWKGKAGAGELPAILSVVVIPEERAVNEARMNMRQFLVNFSAGVTDTSGVQISTRDRTESGALGGIAFSRFRWSGATADRTAVRGLAYGAVDEGRVIAIIAMNFGVNAETENKRMETAIATFKKR